MFCSVITSVTAQEAFTTAGRDTSGTGGSVSYSIGLVVYTVNTGANGSVTQGVQQPYEISVVTGIEKARGINLALSVFPNPAGELLTLNIENYDITDMSYQLFDLKGKLLETQKIESTRTGIPVGHLRPAVYFLRVFDNKMEIKNFKIIKT